jgi:hypothetical protein
MSDSSEQPIIVTAQERAHPALRKLARACISLGRLLRETPETASAPPAAADETTKRPRHD